MFFLCSVSPSTASCGHVCLLSDVYTASGVTSPLPLQLDQLTSHRVGPYLRLRSGRDRTAPLTSLAQRRTSKRRRFCQSPSSESYGVAVKWSSFSLPLLSEVLYIARGEGSGWMGGGLVILSRLCVMSSSSTAPGSSFFKGFGRFFGSV